MNSILAALPPPMFSPNFLDKIRPEKYGAASAVAFKTRPFRVSPREDPPSVFDDRSKLLPYHQLSGIVARPSLIGCSRHSYRFVIVTVAKKYEYRSYMMLLHSTLNESERASKFCLGEKTTAPTRRLLPCGLFLHRELSRSRVGETRAEIVSIEHTFDRPDRARYRSPPSGTHQRYH